MDEMPENCRRRNDGAAQLGGWRTDSGRHRQRGWNRAQDIESDVQGEGQVMSGLQPGVRGDAFDPKRGHRARGGRGGRGGR